VTVPGVWETVLLSLAAYRSWRLLAEDTVLDVPRRKLLRLGGWRQEGDTVPAGYREWWGEMVGCAWCLGAWLSVGWWLVFQVSEHWALVAAVPFAVSATVGLIRTRLDPPE
jgi:hypothetical protein